MFLEDDEVEKKMNEKYYLKLEDVSSFIKKELPSVLITINSIRMFKRFGLSTDFLKMDPIECSEYPDNLLWRQKIRSLRVINDTAERGVKLMKEFNTKITRSKEQKQFFIKSETIFLLLFEDLINLFDQIICN